LGCLENASDLYFDPKRGELLITINRETQPFSNLSDGQRCVLAMVADIAQKAEWLNPHLTKDFLINTPGVVLIDELDLHLHPKWQRRIIEDLRRTFPKIQFICTTHSPFLIQSLRSGDELIMLDDKQPTNALSNLGIETIAEGIMGVDNPDASPRYMAMLEAAKGYLAELNEAVKTPAERLEEYKRQLVARIAPYADNPAFQALLEAESISKLGR
jgi:predicted ATP-binding protein involved in virulence